MFHLVALDRKKVVKATNDALLTAVYNRFFLYNRVLVIKVELGTELVWVSSIRTDGVVKLDDFF